jgi:hypothetical protein
VWLDEGQREQTARRNRPVSDLGGTPNFADVREVRNRSLEAEIEGIKRSTSWRITEPLRAAISTLRGKYLDDRKFLLPFVVTARRFHIALVVSGVIYGF